MFEWMYSCKLLALVADKTLSVKILINYLFEAMFVETAYLRF